MVKLRYIALVQQEKSILRQFGWHFLMRFMLKVCFGYGRSYPISNILEKDIKKMTQISLIAHYKK